MAVLGGVDGPNDEPGRQKAERIQKGVWEGVPPPEESHDTVFILNPDVIHRGCEVAGRRLLKLSLGFSPPCVQVWVVGMRRHLTVIVLNEGIRDRNFKH